MLFISWFLHQTTTCFRRDSQHRLLFISWFLHQTTTCCVLHLSISSCLSLDSYIKPQPSLRWFLLGLCCLSLDSYIKPQPLRLRQAEQWRCLSLDSYIKPQPYWSQKSRYLVVYLLIPTSNHNNVPDIVPTLKLFISWFLHQTTTNIRFIPHSRLLFISWFLHQTTTFP